MTLLGTAIVENTNQNYETLGLTSSLADPFWFQTSVVRFATGLKLYWYRRAFDNLLNNLLRLLGFLQS